MNITDLVISLKNIFEFNFISKYFKRKITDNQLCLAG